MCARPKVASVVLQSSWRPTGELCQSGPRRARTESPSQSSTRYASWVTNPRRTLNPCKPSAQVRVIIALRGSSAYNAHVHTHTRMRSFIFTFTHAHSHAQRPVHTRAHNAHPHEQHPTHARTHIHTHAHTHTRTCALTVPCHSLPTHAGETFVELGMQTVAYAAIAFLDAELSDVPAATPVQQSMSVSPAGTSPAGVPTAPSNPHPPPSGKDTAPWGAAQPAPLPHSMESESPASPKHAEAALQVPVPPPVSGGAPGYYVAPGAGWAAQHAPAPYAPGPAPGPAAAPLHATYNPLMVHAGPPSVPAGSVMTFSPAPPAPWTPVGAPATSPSSHAPFLGTGSSGAAPTSWFGPAYASMCAMVATGDRAAILTGLQVWCCVTYCCMGLSSRWL